MFNDPYYSDWVFKRSKLIIDYFGYEFFNGKTILDLGGGHGDIGASFYRLGSKVTVVDARNEHLKIAAKKYPGINVQLCDLDKVWPFKTFDLILNLDLIPHLKNFESFLRNACNSSNHIVVETACADSDDPNFCVIVQSNKDISDGSYNGHGSRPSAAFIEKILTETGMEWKRFDYTKLGCNKRQYDWVVHNTKSHEDTRRRLWIATRVLPSSQIILPLVGNQPTYPQQSNQSDPVYIDANPAPRYSPPPPAAIPTDEAPTDMRPRMHAPPARKPISLPPNNSGIPQTKMRLFFNYYESGNPERQKELDLCLQKNIENTAFDTIVLDSPDRPTYQFFIDKINVLVKSDDISIFCNSDIFFDSTITLAQQIQSKEVFALSRYDWIKEGDSRLFERPDSQDAWIFRGQIDAVQCNYTLGQLGSDNKFAHDLRRSGYKITNPSLSIKTHHVHNSGIRTYSEKDRLAGPYLFLPIVSLEGR